MGSQNNRENGIIYMIFAEIWRRMQPPEFTGFIKPDITKEIPILRKYCGKSNKNNNSYCKELDKIIFLEANRKYESDPKYRDILNVPAFRKPGSQIMREACYMINNLMKEKESVETIYRTCQDFHKLFEKYK